MAKGSTARPGGPSKIRFIMVEAEIADGDLSQITLAIQNALRGSTPTNHRVAALPATKLAQHAEVALDAEDEMEAEIEPLVEKIIRAPKTSIARKPPAKPTVIAFDLTSDVSLENFTSKLTVTSASKRFLAIAAWFHLHRSLDSITVNHVYTCYRALKWPSGIKDFSQPLRDLKFAQLVTSPEKAHYSINHLGLAEVEKMGNSDK
jgi:hypothetical protein